MNDSEWSEIRRTFGGEIERYCKNAKVIPQKTEHGAYMIPDNGTFNRLKRIFREGQEQRERLMRKKTSLIWQCVPSLKPGNASHGASKKEQSRNKNGFSGSPFMRIELKDSGERSPTLSTSKISKNSILNSAGSGREIAERMMSMKVDHSTTELNSGGKSFGDFALICERLQRNHRRLNYPALLTQLLEGKLTGGMDRKKHRHRQVSREELREFVRLTLERVLPAELFGKYKNKRKIMKAVYGLLDTARFEMFHLGSTVDKLDLKSISWLESIEEEKKRVVVAKLIKWFFGGFILPLLHSQFHVMEDPSLPYGRIFMRIADWCRMRRKYCKTIERRGIIVEAALAHSTPIAFDVPSTGTLKLLPKSTGVRPIVRRRCNDGEKCENAVVLRFLEQLHLMHSNLMSEHLFHQQWRGIVNCRKESGRESLHLISCDINNAFGSVVQERLYNILKILCKDVPERLYFEWYVLLNPRRKFDVSKRYFSNLQLSVPRGVMFTCKKRIPQVIEKKWLLKKIEKCIFFQSIRIYGKKYWIKKGLAQGSAISPILANIYYNYMVQQKMSRFLHEGLLIRYADDIMYITEGNEEAVEFLQLLKKGFPEYNCRFKELKTQTNVPSAGLKMSKSINFLGYKIDCDSLEIEPTYQAAHPRYLLSHVVNANGDIFQIFQRKLNNFASLKLTGAVLDSTINSEETLKRVIKEAGVRLAWRARILILYMFKDIEDLAQDISRIIMLCNKKIRRAIVRRISAGTDILPCWKEREWHRFVGHALLRSYKEVFRKHDRLRHSFKSLLAL